MSVAPSDLRSLAQRMADGTTEAEWRCSVSRSYYCAYHLLRGAVPEPLAGVQGGVHEALVRFFVSGAEQVTTQRKTLAMRIGYKLQSLRSLRVAADYGLDGPFSRCDAQVGMRTCDEIKPLFDEFRR